MGQQHSQDKTGMREARKRSMKRLNGWLGLLLLGLVSASLCLLSAGKGPSFHQGGTRQTMRGERQQRASQAKATGKATDQRGNIGESERPGATFKAAHQGPRHALRTGSEGAPKTRPTGQGTRDQQWPRKPSKPSKVPMLWPSLGSHRCNLLAAAPASRGLLVYPGLRRL